MGNAETELCIRLEVLYLFVAIENDHAFYVLCLQGGEEGLDTALTMCCWNSYGVFNL